MFVVVCSRSKRLPGTRAPWPHWYERRGLRPGRHCSRSNGFASTAARPDVCRMNPGVAKRSRRPGPQTTVTAVVGRRVQAVRDPRPTRRDSQRYTPNGPPDLTRRPTWSRSRPEHPPCDLAVASAARPKPSTVRRPPTRNTTRAGERTCRDLRAHVRPDAVFDPATEVLHRALTTENGTRPCAATAAPPLGVLGLHQLIRAVRPRGARTPTAPPPHSSSPSISKTSLRGPDRRHRLEHRNNGTLSARRCNDFLRLSISRSSWPPSEILDVGRTTHPSQPHYGKRSSPRQPASPRLRPTPAGCDAHHITQLPARPTTSTTSNSCAGNTTATNTPTTTTPAPPTHNRTATKDRRFANTSSQSFSSTLALRRE